MNTRTVSRDCVQVGNGIATHVLRFPWLTVCGKTKLDSEFTDVFGPVNCKACENALRGRPQTSMVYRGFGLTIIPEWGAKEDDDSFTDLRIYPSEEVGHIEMYASTTLKDAIVFCQSLIDIVVDGDKAPQFHIHFNADGNCFSGKHHKLPPNIIVIKSPFGVWEKNTPNIRVEKDGIHLDYRLTWLPSVIVDDKDGMNKKVTT